MRKNWALSLLAGALVVFPHLAHAQRVVILEVDGDRGNHLREQVERAVRKSGKVELVSIKRYREAAARKHLRGMKAMSPAGVAQVSRGLAFEAAVGGTLSDTFFVRILDSQGGELWSKDLPVREGMLSSGNARKLANAIAYAATQASPPPSREQPVASRDGEAEAPESDAPVIKTPPRTTPAATMPSLDVSSDESSTETRAEGSGSSSADADLEAEIKRTPGRVAPRLINVQLTGTTTWRSYCSRPGVQSCGAYDALAPAQRPPGDTVDFSPQVPYAGVGLTAYVFPFQSFDNVLKGLGAEGSYARGYSLTNVDVQTTGGTGPAKQVVSIDEAYDGALVGRYFWDFGGDRKDPLLAYVGLRLAYMFHTFEVDPTAQVPLPGSHRRFPAAGVDGCLPILKYLRIEAGALYFFAPDAGPDEVVGYGSAVSSSGFGLQAGLAGTIWGPLGYVLRFNMQSYTDHFTGAGNKWTNGGVAQETYSGLYWGATAQF